jgi:hypothetical protein
MTREMPLYLLARLACRTVRLHTRFCRGRGDHVRADGSVRVRWGS